jgi:hypothetical protein
MLGLFEKPDDIISAGNNPKKIAPTMITIDKSNIFR